MIAAGREEPVSAQPCTREQAGELERLRTLYQVLPEDNSKYTSVPGVAFLEELNQLLTRYPTRRIATLLGCTIQGVRYMSRRPVNRSPKLWPSDEDMRDLRAAWRIAMAAGRRRRAGYIRRQDPEYLPLHNALIALRTRQYEIQEIAKRLGVEPRALLRFENDQHGNPFQIATAVRRVLDDQNMAEPNTRP